MACEDCAQVKKERDEAIAHASKIATEFILGAATLTARAEKAEQENARLREALATAVRFYDERVLIGGSMECVHWLKAARTALGGE